MYLLPAIDILGGRAVRLAKGDYDRVSVYNEDPLEQARIFEAAGATWLHMVDLDGAKSGAPDNIAIIERIVAATSLHVEVGGGIRTLDTLERLADIGVSRMVLGTALVNDPEFAIAAVERFGDMLAAGIDAREGEVALTGWTEGSGVAADKLARKVAGFGYRHLVFTDIARDGMQTGIDEHAYAAMARAFGHPVIASGGVAGVADIERLARVGEAVEGVIVGRAVYEGALSVEEGVAACAAATASAPAPEAVEGAAC